MYNTMEYLFSGINQTIFITGPKNSGKSYTALGTGIDPGLIILFMQQLLEYKIKWKKSINIKLSIFQFSQQRFYDLLCKTDIPIYLKCFNKITNLQNLYQANIFQMKDFLMVLKQGLFYNKWRDFKFQRFNNQVKLKSHFIVRVKVDGYNDIEQKYFKAKVLFVDFDNQTTETHNLSQSIIAFENIIKSKNPQLFNLSKFTKYLRQWFQNSKVKIIACLSTRKQYLLVNKQFLTMLKPAKNIQLRCNVQNQDQRRIDKIKCFFKEQQNNMQSLLEIKQQPSQQKDLELNNLIEKQLTSSIQYLKTFTQFITKYLKLKQQLQLFLGLLFNQTLLFIKKNVKTKTLLEFYTSKTYQVMEVQIYSSCIIHKQRVQIAMKKFQKQKNKYQRIIKARKQILETLQKVQYSNQDNRIQLLLIKQFINIVIRFTKYNECYFIKEENFCSFAQTVLKRTQLHEHIQVIKQNIQTLQNKTNKRIISKIKQPSIDKTILQNIQLLPYLKKQFTNNNERILRYSSLKPNKKTIQSMHLPQILDHHTISLSIFLRDGLKESTIQFQEEPRKIQQDIIIRRHKKKPTQQPLRKSLFPNKLAKSIRSKRMLKYLSQNNI